jgi:AcrR family transcriptional regulator
MFDREMWELLSYVVTVVGLPMAILVFIYEQRKDRQNDEEEVYQRLSDEYTDFLKLVLENADLHLFRQTADMPALNAEQLERKYLIFGLLVALFERAYLLVYEPHMSRQTARMWATWDDYMREWCRREDFRTMMVPHLDGEDPDFKAYILRLAEEEKARSKSRRAPTPG